MKWLLLFLIIIFCVPIFINCRNEDRIINGHKTPLGQFMFLPKFYMSYSYTGKDGAPRTKSPFECSSTIISKRHILTAAHCVLDDSIHENVSEMPPAYPFFVDVRPIEKDKLKGLKNINITNFGITSNVYVHEKYGENLVHDIAILEFPENVNLNITPVILAKDYVDNYSDVAIAAGYGNYLFNVTYQNVSDDSPPTLRNVNVKIRSFFDFLGISEDDPEIKNMNSSEKAEFDNDVKDAQKRLICAGNSGELPQRADHGDSGGPLLYELNGNFYQLGIASFIDPTNVRSPGCYTRISNYCDWIEKHSNNEAKCEEMYVTESLPTTQYSTFTELPVATEPITANEPLLPNNENSPRKEELKSLAPTFVMNFGFFWIVFFLKFLYVSLF